MILSLSTGALLPFSHAEKTQVRNLWKKLVKMGAKYGGTFDFDKKTWGRKRV